MPPQLDRWDIINPEILVTLAVNNVIEAQQDSAREWLWSIVNKLINQDSTENKDRSDLVKASLERALVNSKTTQGDIYLLVRWLFLHYGARNKDLGKIGLLPADYRELVPNRKWWHKSLSVPRKRN